MGEPDKGICPYCDQLVPVYPDSHVCGQKGAGAVLNQPGPKIPLADQPERDDPPVYRPDMFRQSAQEAGKREAWAAVCELFGVESVPKLIELSERVKQQQNGTAPTPDWDGIVTTLLESNAKLSETISAQGDQIMALSRENPRGSFEDIDGQIRRANMNGVNVSEGFAKWFVESRTAGYLRQFLELAQA